jgi:hypothetical protein
MSDDSDNFVDSDFEDYRVTGGGGAGKRDDLVSEVDMR